ncbi:cupredoxin domain-containing protein [Oryzihumus sp.]|jgi:plastocyanin|uniref:cupredoxin domain-containing protein n=1 Tax=Oryzihumus sp. TaxID=1968903 RepID=UPI002ED87D75
MSSPPSLRRLRWALAALCALTLAVAFTAPASATGASTSHPRTWHVSVAAESHNKAIQTMAFMPGTIWVNAGDSILWTVRAGEIHTVTFLASGQKLPEFNPFDPKMVTRQGGSSYDGHSYYNSGLLSNQGKGSGFPAGFTYTLKFPRTGNFTYWCLVHGMFMKGTVHVRAAGTKYPFTQADYNRQADHKKAADLREGQRLWNDTAKKATNHTVYAGADGKHAMVMRFIDPHVKIHVGDSVTFKNSGMLAPHTITFGPERTNIFVPYGDPKHFAGGQLNSGILLPGHNFTVTFTKAGKYSFICALHDFLGMVGTVTVTS